MVSLAIVDAIELESETGKITQIEAIEKLLRTIESCELRKKLAPSLPPISTPGPKALPALKPTKKTNTTTKKDIAVEGKREHRHQRGNGNQCKARGEFLNMVPRSSWGSWEAPETDDVFSEGLRKVLGSSWGGFGALGWSLGRSWEVQMLLFP